MANKIHPDDMHDLIVQMMKINLVAVEYGVNPASDAELMTLIHDTRKVLARESMYENQDEVLEFIGDSIGDPERREIMVSMFNEIFESLSLMGKTEADRIAALDALEISITFPKILH